MARFDMLEMSVLGIDQQARGNREGRGLGFRGQPAEAERAADPYRAAEDLGGEFDKAADQLSKGVSKGSLKSEADARLTLGIAQLKGGHKDEAMKTFKAVKGDPTLERLANLWTLHAKQA